MDAATASPTLAPTPSSTVAPVASLWDSTAPFSSPLSAAMTDAALQLAWERVRSNGGAAGADHQTLYQFGLRLPKQLARLQTEVADGSYTPQPLWLVPIPKRQGGQRVLAIPAVRDRVLQTAVAHLIGPHLDNLFGTDSYGYRPGRSVAQAIARVQAYRDAGLVAVVDADIRSFFDHIDHARLLRVLGEQVLDTDIQRLVSLWLSAVLWERGKLPRLQTKGVAQGSPLSPLLSNLYLDAFDHTLQAAGLAVVRYADDFVVLCPDMAAASQALALVRQVLIDFKLELNEAKTHLTSFEAGFDFLGVRFRRHHVEAIHPEAQPWLLPSYVRPEPQPMPTATGPETQAPPMPHSPAPSEQAAGAELASIDPALDEALDDTSPAPAPPSDIHNTTHHTQHSVQVLSAERAAPLLQSLYVGEPGCWLTKEHDRVVVSCQHQVRASVPLGLIDQIAILDNAMLSTALLRHCAQRRIRVAVAGWGDQLLMLERGSLSEQRLLQAQWAAQDDAGMQLLLASCFVEGKLHNSCTILRRLSRRQSRQSLASHIHKIEQMQARLAHAADLNSVRGLEGQAARQYFEALRLLLPVGADFAGRSRRPPRDPVNASLSLGYAVLANNLHTLVRLEGLNAHIGHLHATVAGGMALVSDLIEEFRAPIVDSVVVQLWRQGKLSDTDFEWSQDPDELPCRLRSAGRHVLLDALEAKLETQMMHPGTERLLDMRRIMQAQIRHYLRVLLHREPVYRPFKLR